jgi:hypothetical protein
MVDANIPVDKVIKASQRVDIQNGLTTVRIMPNTNSAGVTLSVEGHLNIARDMTVGGDVKLVGGDLAEEFDFDSTIGAFAEPGTVVSINELGMMEPSSIEYDKRVVGIVPGAGTYRPGIILDKEQVEVDGKKRIPLALAGKVFCKVDADYNSIEVGDLLTSSMTPGHAMKAAKPTKALGTIIGKALRPLKEGKGMIPVLVALQ